jgi:APA family basic amino acid/polyamine antiporter
VPLIYIVLAFLFVVDLGYLAWRTSGIGYLIVLTGIPAYLIWRKQACKSCVRMCQKPRAAATRIRKAREIHSARFAVILFREACF